MLAQNVCGRVAGQVDVRMVDHVDDGRLGGDDLHRYPQGGSVELVRRAHVTRTGVAHLAGRAGRAERDATLVVLRVPRSPVPAVAAAVQVVEALVPVQLVLVVADPQPASGDPVLVAAYRGTEVAGRGRVRLARVEAEDDVGQRSDA